MEILRTERLTKIYGEKENQVVAISDINLSIEKGEFVAIVGSSGSLGSPHCFIYLAGLTVQQMAVFLLKMKIFIV